LSRIVQLPGERYQFVEQDHTWSRKPEQLDHQCGAGVGARGRR
jgi:hypothetical protein